VLKEIYISDFALMDNIHICFYPGFNIFTGETGAGKSNLIDAISLIMGQRAREDYIRTGKDESVIESIFDISSNSTVKKILSLNGIEVSDEILISRTISRKGKNSSRVNGRPVTASMLSELASCLIEIQGQHENQILFMTQKHLHILDNFCGPSLILLREEVSRKYRELKALEQELNLLKKDDREKLQRMDFLRFEIQEIEEASLVDSEEEQLLEERLFLSNIEKMERVLAEIFSLIDRDIGFDFLADTILKNLREAVSMDKNLNSFLERFENIYYEFQDLNNILHQYSDSLEFDPERLEEVINRLSIINRLKRKYGNSVSEILSYLETARKELNSLSNSERMLQDLQKKHDKFKELLLEEMKKLSRERKKGAQSFEGAVNNELSQIGMDHARLSVAFYNEEKEELTVTEEGIDDIEFLFSANRGEPLKPLVKIASGGEMSRVMLALKSALAKVKSIDCLIFDEVDSGLGGEAASKVGSKLLSLSSSYQVICVTHLPQIASLGNSHFLLYKTEVKGRVISQVKELEGEERILEISRMLEGEDRTNASRKLAIEMINTSVSKRKGRRMKK